MSDKTSGASRRDLLKLAALGVPATATVALTGTTAAAATMTETAGEGLRKTAHVQAYLDSARF